jgi:hypothetical protein
MINMTFQKNLVWINAEFRVMLIKAGKELFNCCSVVSKATRYALDGSGFEFRGGDMFCST